MRFAFLDYASRLSFQRIVIALRNKRYQLVQLRGVRTRLLLCVRSDRHSLFHKTTKLKVNSSAWILEPRIHACHLNKDCAA